jgi:hypothetical protein
MKITDLLKENNYSSLEAKIIHYADLICDSYLKRAKKTHERVGFSNELGDKFRELITNQLTSDLKISNPEEIARVHLIVSKAVTNPYFEFKLNNIMY